MVAGGVLVPVESEVLPAQLEALAGSAPVMAQDVDPPVVSGAPEACADQWVEQGSTCVREASACPPSPLTAGELLAPSVHFPDLDDVARYVDFCEQRFLRPPEVGDGELESPGDEESRRRFEECVAGRDGFISLRYEVPGEPAEGDGAPLEGDEPPEGEPIPGCRVLRPAGCEVGLHRVTSGTCRAVVRRNWACPDEYVPRNDFNTCYKEPPPPDGDGHPACGDGAPVFVAAGCAEYVGNDFHRSPEDVDCGGFLAGLATEMVARSSPGGASDYWCSFDESLLRVACHGSSPPGVGCEESPASCLKRASEVGGCHTIARAITCSNLQALLAEGLRTAEHLESAGCRPCVVLPFQPVPDDCPEELRNDPHAPGGEFHAALHRVKADFVPNHVDCLPVQAGQSLEDVDACRNLPVCADPPRGRLVWESSHFSDHAIVNSAVVITVVDIPASTRRVSFFRLNPTSQRSPLTTRGENVFVYPDGVLGDPVIRLLPAPDPDRSYSSVLDILDGGVECYVSGRPHFKVTIEELWPDNPEHETAIADLFGPHALDWWTEPGVSDEDRRRLTTNRGLVPWEDLTDDERTQRDAELTQSVDCNVGADVWCRWLPARRGYYRLTAAGAWRLKKLQESRDWWDSGGRSLGGGQSIYTLLVEALANAADEDNNCPAHFDTSSERIRDKDCIRDDLDGMGYAQPQEAGLTGDLSNVEPRPPGAGREWLFTDLAGENFRCPARDLRVYCRADGLSGNYTETNPIGIAVHEIRVATRNPNR